MLKLKQDGSKSRNVGRETITVSLGLEGRGICGPFELESNTGDAGGQGFPTQK
jgi:hypothetical protein